MFRIPTFIVPHFPLSPLTLAAYIILSISIVVFLFFWIWSMFHAARTPRAPLSQRLLWVFCILMNPTATIWYWCVWQRWAFWALFTPLIGIFIALPFVVRSIMSKADATSVTNALFALGSNALIIFFAILLIYPIILRLIVVLNLTTNKDITAMDRNDWVVTLAFPIIGFGAALVYALRHIKTWAFISLGWMIVFSITSKLIIFNVAPILVPAGEEKREEYKAEKTTTTTKTLEELDD